MSSAVNGFFCMSLWPSNSPFSAKVVDGPSPQSCHGRVAYIASPLTFNHAPIFENEDKMVERFDTINNWRHRLWFPRPSRSPFPGRFTPNISGSPCLTVRQSKSTFFSLKDQTAIAGGQASQTTSGSRNLPNYASCAGLPDEISYSSSLHQRTSFPTGPPRNTR